MGSYQGNCHERAAADARTDPGPVLASPQAMASEAIHDRRTIGAPENWTGDKRIGSRIGALQFTCTRIAFSQAFGVGDVVHIEIQRADTRDVIACARTEHVV